MNCKTKKKRAETKLLKYFSKNQKMLLAFYVFGKIIKRGCQFECIKSKNDIKQQRLKTN